MRISNRSCHELRRLLGDRFSQSQVVCQQHGKGESYHPAVPPEAVAFIQSTKEVVDIMKLCHKEKIPVIPFGAGSSLEGHLNAVQGGLTLNLSGLKDIVQVQPQDLSCRVQAGVTRVELDSYLRDTGLFFPADPGAEASLGGMVSTNASGTTTVKYGNMKQNVMGLTVVLSDGRVIETGSKARKSSAGYDLTRLFIGAEGTLGIITEIQLRLHGIPETIRTGVFSFPNIHQTVETCATMMQMGIPVARMELMDATTIEATNTYSNLSNPVAPSLLVELHGSNSEVTEQSELVTQVAAESMSSQVSWAATPEDRKKLWTARHNVWYATLHTRPGSYGLVTDVCVPISQLAQVIVDTQQDMLESNLYGTILGHVGDGNFHVILPMDPEDKEEVDRIQRFSDRLVQRAIAVEGTCTGEHGIGTGKMDYLQLEHGSDAIDVMRSIKLALDPSNLLNPGKIFYGKKVSLKNQ